MKKFIISFISAAIMSSLCQFTASADETSFREAFFYGENISTPTAAPYIVYNDKDSDGVPFSGLTQIYYDIPDDANEMCKEYNSLGFEEFDSMYGITILDSLYIQTDVQFDGGSWLSESGDWDKLNYGEDLISNNSAFCLQNSNWLEDCSLTQNFTQSNLSCYVADDASCAFLKPYILTETDSDGNNIYRLDLENHTIAYRYRVFAAYYLSDNEEPHCIFSGWSPSASIGKNGVQEEPQKPESIVFPNISDLTLKNGDNGLPAEAHFNIDIPREIYDGEKYFVSKENAFEPYHIESQVRIDGGEWENAYTVNAAWITSGERTVDLSIIPYITADSTIELRSRMVCSEMDNLVSGWSNVLTASAEDSEVPETATLAEEVSETPTSTKSAEESKSEDKKCSLCKFCPHPLGICIFIWIAAAAAVIAVIIIVKLRLGRKNKK